MADAIYSKGAMVQSWLHWESLFVYYIKSEVQTEYILFPVTYNLKCAYFLV